MLSDREGIWESAEEVWMEKGKAAEHNVGIRLSFVLFPGFFFFFLAALTVLCPIKTDDTIDALSTIVLPPGLVFFPFLLSVYHLMEKGLIIKFMPSLRFFSFSFP